MVVVPTSTARPSSQAASRPRPAPPRPPGPATPRPPGPNPPSGTRREGSEARRSRTRDPSTRAAARGPPVAAPRRRWPPGGWAPGGSRGRPVIAGSRGTVRSHASLRTTWLRSAGSARARTPARRRPPGPGRPSRIPAARAAAPSACSSTVDGADRVSGADSMWTRHFLQVPLPPQMLSISTPSARATESRSWPAAAEPRRPEGWKVTVKVAAPRWRRETSRSC